MPNYKELYFSLYGKVAQLTEQLIEIQRELEERYLEECEQETVVQLTPKLDKVN